MLKVILSAHSSQADSPRANCPGLYLKNICRNGDSITSLGNLWQYMVPLLVKKCFLMLRKNFLCSHCLWSSHWAPLKWPWHLAPSLQVFIYTDKIFLTLLFPRLKSHRFSASPNFTAHSWSSLWPFYRVSPICPHLPCIGKLKTGLHTPGVAPPALSGGEGSSFTCLQYSS